MPTWLGAKISVDPAPPKTPFSGLQVHTSNPLTFDANSLVDPVRGGRRRRSASRAFFKFTDIGIGVRALGGERRPGRAARHPRRNALDASSGCSPPALSSLGIFLRIPVIGLPIGVVVGPSSCSSRLAAAVIAPHGELRRRVGRAAIALGRDRAVALLLLPRRQPRSRAFDAAGPARRHARSSAAQLSRGQDTGSHLVAGEGVPPDPPELRAVPEVVWGASASSARRSARVADALRRRPQAADPRRRSSSSTASSPCRW